MAALAWTGADGVTRALASDAPAMASALPAADFTPEPGPFQGPLAWPLAGGDAVGFKFRDRDQYARLTIAELAADAATQALGVLAAGHLSDGGRARLATHDRAGRVYLVDVGPRGSAAFGRMAVGEPRYQLALTVRNRESRNLLAPLGSVTLDTGLSPAAGWAFAADAGLTASHAYDGAAHGQQLTTTAAAGAGFAAVESGKALDVRPGDVLALSAEAASVRTGGAWQLYLSIRYYDAANAFVGNAGDLALPVSASYARYTTTATAPAGAAKAAAYLAAWSPAAGSTGFGTFRLVQLERAGAFTAFDASAAPAPFVVAY